MPSRRYEVRNNVISLEPIPPKYLYWYTPKKGPALAYDARTLARSILAGKPIFANLRNAIPPRKQRVILEKAKTNREMLTNDNRAKIDKKLRLLRASSRRAPPRRASSRRARSPASSNSSSNDNLPLLVRWAARYGAPSRPPSPLAAHQ